MLETSNLVISKRFVLEELRKAFSGMFSASNMLDGKLQNILNYSSVIISVISAILTVAGKFPDGISVGKWYWVFLLLSVFLYCIMFVRIRIRLLPIFTGFPISGDIEELKEKYFDIRFNEERILDQAIFDYLHFINSASSNNDLKAKEINVSSWFMFAIIVFLLCTALFGLVFPTV